jgi:hypothetical protein
MSSIHNSDSKISLCIVLNFFFIDLLFFKFKTQIFYIPEPCFIFSTLILFITVFVLVCLLDDLDHKNYLRIKYHGKYGDN